MSSNPWPQVTAALEQWPAEADESKADASQGVITLTPEAETAKTPRVTRSEQARMLRYRHQDGMTYEAIATTLKRSIQTVHAYLSPLESTVDEARAKLAAAGSEAVDHWIMANQVAATQGKYQGMQALLAATGAIQVQPDTAIAIQVNVPQGGESRSDNRMPKAMQELSSSEHET